MYHQMSEAFDSLSTTSSPSPSPARHLPPVVSGTPMAASSSSSSAAGGGQAGATTTGTPLATPTAATPAGYYSSAPTVSTGSVPNTPVAAAGTPAATPASTTVTPAGSVGAPASAVSERQPQIGDEFSEMFLNREWQAMFESLLAMFDQSSSGDATRIREVFHSVTTTHPFQQVPFPTLMLTYLHH
jgi:hypothetical protein